MIRRSFGRCDHVAIDSRHPRRPCQMLTSNKATVTNHWYCCPIVLDFLCVTNPLAKLTDNHSCELEAESW